MRALHGRGTLRVPVIGREASRPYDRNHSPFSPEAFEDPQEFLKLAEGGAED
jgi:hypothetical protein